MAVDLASESAVYIVILCEQFSRDDVVVIYSMPLAQVLNHQPQFRGDGLPVLSTCASEIAKVVADQGDGFWVPWRRPEICGAVVVSSMEQCIPATDKNAVALSAIDAVTAVMKFLTAVVSA